jgi:hypothetical protein
MPARQRPFLVLAGVLTAATLAMPAAAQWPNPGWRPATHWPAIFYGGHELMYFDYSPRIYPNTYPSRCFFERRRLVRRSRHVVRHFSSC